MGIAVNIFILLAILLAVGTISFTVVDIVREIRSNSANAHSANAQEDPPSEA